MDRTIVFAFIPILALAIPVAGVIMWGLQKISRTRLEETRLRLQGGDTSEDMQAMQQDIETLRRELAELQERVDFAERIIARQPDHPALPPDRQQK